MRTLILASLLAACSLDRTSQVPGVQQHGVMSFQYVDGAAPKVDVLFVIDSSPAMAPYLPQVRETLGLVASQAEARLRGPRANLHVGVLTADLGDGTANSGTTLAGCSGTGDGAALRRSALVDGAYMIDRYTPSVDLSNYHAAFADTMMALTDVGDTGCAHVQPLEAIRLALDQNPHNAGFLRDDAKLAIVILAAEDDASPGDPAAYRTFVESLKADPDDAMVAVAAPDGSTRLGTFAEGKVAPLTGTGVVDFVFQNACVPSSSGEGFPSTCLYGDLLDLDAAQPGVQPSCVASDSGGSYAACGDGAATPCWRISQNAGFCGDDLVFTIDRGALDPPSLTNLVTVECVTR